MLGWKCCIVWIWYGIRLCLCIYCVVAIGNHKSWLYVVLCSTLIWFGFSFSFNLLEDREWDSFISRESLQTIVHLCIQKWCRRKPSSSHGSLPCEHFAIYLEMPLCQSQPWQQLGLLVLKHKDRQPPRLKFQTVELTQSNPWLLESKSLGRDELHRK